MMMEVLLDGFDRMLEDLLLVFLVCEDVDAGVTSCDYTPLRGDSMMVIFGLEIRGSIQLGVALKAGMWDSRSRWRGGQMSRTWWDFQLA
jgi:hypothetical protein